MNKLVIGVILGIILVTVGGILLAYSTYYSTIAYQSFNCYNLYPPHYNNITQAANYSPSYYTCENNATISRDNAVLYSSMSRIPGWICVFAGAITFILSLTLLFIAVYKDRNISQKPKK